MSDIGGVDATDPDAAQPGTDCRCGRQIIGDGDGNRPVGEANQRRVYLTKANGTWQVAEPPTIEELIGRAPSGAAIHEVAQEAERMLLEKNISYGDSALNPIGVFAKGLDATHLLQVRIDDKLARISNQQHYPGDDDVLDLIGYLLLLRIANRRWVT